MLFGGKACPRFSRLSTVLASMIVRGNGGQWRQHKNDHRINQMYLFYVEPFVL